MTPQALHLCVLKKLRSQKNCHLQNLSPVFYFNLVKSVQDPLHFSPHVRISHDVKQIEEVLPIGRTRIRRTTLKSILPCVATPPTELVGLEYVEVGVIDLNMLTCGINRSEASSLMFFPILVDPSLRI